MQSIVRFVGAVIDGGVVSSIVKVAVVSLKLPQSSVALKVTVAVPVVPHSSEIESPTLLPVSYTHLTLPTTSRV